MSERYSKLFSLPVNLFTPGAPIIVAAGALLKDNETGRTLVQLKFKNSGDNEIKMVKVNIFAFDVMGKQLKGIEEYQYLDLYAGHGADFGQTQAIPLPDATTRSFNVEVTSCLFSDGSEWKAPDTAEWRPLPAKTLLLNTLGIDLAAQYQRDVTRSAKYTPFEYDSIWVCACGAENSTARCYNCASEKSVVFSSMDKEKLENNKKIYDDGVAVTVKKATKFAKIAGIIAIPVLTAIIVISAILNTGYRKTAKDFIDGLYGGYESKIVSTTGCEYSDAEDITERLEWKLGLSIGSNWKYKYKIVDKEGTANAKNVTVKVELSGYRDKDTVMYDLWMVKIDNKWQIVYFDDYAPGDVRMAFEPEALEKMAGFFTGGVPAEGGAIAEGEVEAGEAAPDEEVAEPREEVAEEAPYYW